jgi:hypothetical protein
MPGLQRWLDLRRAKRPRPGGVRRAPPGTPLPRTLLPGHRRALTPLLRPRPLRFAQAHSAPPPPASRPPPIPKCPGGNLSTSSPAQAVTARTPASQPRGDSRRPFPAGPARLAPPPERGSSMRRSSGSGALQLCCKRWRGQAPAGSGLLGPKQNLTLVCFRCDCTKHENPKTAATVTYADPWTSFSFIPSAGVAFVVTVASMIIIEKS